MAKESGKDKEDGYASFDGSKDKLEDMDLRMFRWCRSKYDTKLGNGLWSNDLPDILDLQGDAWTEYTDMVYDSINDRNPSLAKSLFPVESGFYSKKWHRQWVRKQFDKIYDKVESLCTGAAALEVQTLGMENAPQMRAHLLKQFGGSGDDVRARERVFDMGMPTSANSPAFPPNCDIEDRLRTLHAERVALLKMCKPSLKGEYEYGKESHLVKIVLRCLSGGEYQKDIDVLLQEIKLRKNMMAKLPVLNAATGLMELPIPVDEQEVADDWDYRNYSDEWIPSWSELKSKLVSAYKTRQFQSNHAKPSKAHQPLPCMYTPGLGTSPKPPTCFGCGQVGHRRGDSICTAGPNDWAECTPPKFRAKMNGKGKGVSGSRGMKEKRRNGSSSGNVDGFTGTSGDGVCYSFRDTGKCRFGPNCKFKHVVGVVKPWL